MFILFTEHDTRQFVDHVCRMAASSENLDEAARRAIGEWRDTIVGDQQRTEDLVELLNQTMAAQLDTRFTRRVKSRGRAETLRR